MDDNSLRNVERKMAVKKVALVVNSSWNIYNFRYNLIKDIKANGYEVILIAPHDKYSDILKKEFEYYPIFINNKGMNPIEDVKTFMAFYTVYKKVKPDVVLHYTIKPNIYGSLASRLLGIKTINNIAGLGTLFIKQNFMTQFAKKLYKISQKSADTIFFQNRDDYTMFTSEDLVSEFKSDILPGSGVDINKFKPIEQHGEASVFKFLLVSRMLWSKGIREYVTAARALKKTYSNVEICLLGFLDVENRDAISKEQMEAWVDEGVITYLGTSDNVQDEIAKVDCIVLPSFYREGTPKILLESASMAKPIITTDNVGCRDVVEHGLNGYLCKTQDAQDLTIQMEKMVNLSKEELTYMGQRGRKKMMNQFNEKIVIQKYLNAISDQKLRRESLYRCVEL